MADFLQNPELALSLVVGETDERDITWVHTTELADPSPYLRGGEFVLTNGLWHTEAGNTTKYVDSLLQVGALALGYGLEADASELPSDVVEECRTRGLALVAVPHLLPFMAIAQCHVEFTRNEDEKSLRRTANAHELLAQLVTADKSPGSILQVLSIESGLHVFVMIGPHEVVGNPPDGLDWHECWEHLSAAGAFPAGKTLQSGQGMLGVPLDSAGSNAAYVVAIATDAINSMRQRELLRASSAYLSLELAPLLRKREKRQRQVRRMIAALLRQEKDAASAVEKLCEIAGWPKSPHLTPVVIRHRGESHLKENGIPSLHAKVLDNYEQDGFAGSYGGISLVLLGPQPISNGQIEEILTALLAHCPPQCSAGYATSAADLNSLPVLTADALHAADIAPVGDNRIAAFSQLGRRTTVITPDPALREAFVRYAIGPLVDHDQLRGSELVMTLVTFLQNGAGFATSADALHIHVNTLRYRLAQIASLSGRDLTKTSDIVDLYLALELSGELPSAPMRRS